MTVRRETGGMMTFVDNGSHNSSLTIEESNEIDQAYERAHEREIREKEERRLRRIEREKKEKLKTIFVIVGFVIVILVLLVLIFWGVI